jgi:transcriptional regulator with XRE-family HTH domain
MGRRELVAEKFGERLREERGHRGLSQAQLAKLLSARGVTAYPTTIAKIETGERVVRIEELAAIADLFDLSLDALIGRRERPSGDLDYAERALRDTVERTAIAVTEQLLMLGDATGVLDTAMRALHPPEWVWLGDQPASDQYEALRYSVSDLTHALLNARELAQRINGRESTEVWIVTK